MRISGHFHPPSFNSARPLNAANDDITAETVASILNIKPSTVANWARRGIIPSYKLGRFRHYSRADILAWRQANRDASARQRL